LVFRSLKSINTIRITQEIKGVSIEAHVQALKIRQLTDLPWQRDEHVSRQLREKVNPRGESILKEKKSF